MIQFSKETDLEVVLSVFLCISWTHPFSTCSSFPGCSLAFCTARSWCFALQFCLPLSWNTPLFECSTSFETFPEKGCIEDNSFWCLMCLKIPLFYLHAWLVVSLGVKFKWKYYFYQYHWTYSLSLSNFQWCNWKVYLYSSDFLQVSFFSPCILIPCTPIPCIVKFCDDAPQHEPSFNSLVYHWEGFCQTVPEKFVYRDNLLPSSPLFLKILYSLFNFLIFSLLFFIPMCVGSTFRNSSSTLSLDLLTEFYFWYHIFNLPKLLILFISSLFCWYNIWEYWL